MSPQHRLQTYERKTHECAAEEQSSDKDDKTFFVGLLIHLQRQVMYVASAKDSFVLKQVPEQDIGCAILYFQLGQETAVQQRGAPWREEGGCNHCRKHWRVPPWGSPATLLLLWQAPMRRKRGIKHLGVVSPAFETRNKASHMMFQDR